MALELNDLLAMKSLEGKDNSPYEQYMMAHKESKRASGTAIAGLVLGTVGAAVDIGAWIFGGTYANGKAAQAREAARSASDLANANHSNMLALFSQAQANTNATIDRLASTLAAERTERIAGDFTISQTQTDTQSGSQASQLSAMQQAELNASQQLMLGLQTGQYSQNPQKVVLVSGQRECGCPATGCGCGD